MALSQPMIDKINQIKALKLSLMDTPLGEPFKIEEFTSISFLESANMYYPFTVVSVTWFKPTSPIHQGKFLVAAAQNEPHYNELQKLGDM